VIPSCDRRALARTRKGFIWSFHHTIQGRTQGQKAIYCMSQEERLAQHKAKGYCTHCRTHGHKTDECHKLKAEHEKGKASARVATDSTVMRMQAQDDSDDVICLF